MKPLPVTPVRARTVGAIALIVAGLVACFSPPTSPAFHYTVPAQPEGASGYTEKPGWATSKFAVAAANPLATAKTSMLFVRPHETFPVHLCLFMLDVMHGWR